jgi:hypothetical protein
MIDFPKEMECYDIVSDTWTLVAAVIEGRYASGAVTINKSVGSAEKQDQQDLFDMLIVKSANTTRRPWALRK